MVGIRPLGLRARYAGVSTTPKAMPASMRSNGRSSSAQHHSTFWTLIEFVRPQIMSMLHLPRYNLLGAPPLRKGARVVPAMVRRVEPFWGHDRSEGDHRRSDPVFAQVKKTNNSLKVSAGASSCSVCPQSSAR